MMQFFKTPKFDYISKRKAAYMFSTAMILIGFAAAIVRGGYNLSIDFKGGTSLVVVFQGPVKTEQVRRVLSQNGFGGSEIKKFGGLN